METIAQTFLLLASATTSKRVNSLPAPTCILDQTRGWLLRYSCEPAMGYSLPY